MFAAVLALAGAVVTVHSATTHDHLGDVVVMCVAVAETAVVAAGGALVVGALLSRPLWTLAEPHGPELAFSPVQAGAPARAGPPRLQVFQL